MKKKIVATVFACICVVVAFSACCFSQSANATNNTPKTIFTAQAAEKKLVFKLIEVDYYNSDTSCISVYRETTTDVMYMTFHENHGGGLTVMIDPQTGGPLTYTNWLNNYANK